jgi:DNA-binding response OmpR family regulator
MNERQRIMVVDNDQGTRQLLNHTLAKEGFDTIVIADTSEALALLKEMDPDLVILDTAPNGSDGLQTLDLIREYSDVPVIMLSTEREVASLQKALSHGADDYISRPFSTRTFVARIRAKLRRARKAVR